MDIKNIIDKNFRGVVYVLQDNNILCERVSGFRDLANELPNTIDTKFASASAGKVFVAVGILQLIECGKLSFDDTLETILAMDLHNIDPKVTVRQLLTGYVLLAMMIEKVTGMYFDEYLQKNIFSVCDMKSTGYYELDKLPANCANHYIYCNDSGDYRTNIFSVDVKGTGAGGAFITVKDIAAFWKGLLEGKLLSPEMISEMLRKQSGDGSDKEEGYYGYGVWMIDNNGKKDIPYFQGCDPGVSFISEYNPNNNMISVLVSNYGDNVWAEMRKIRQLTVNFPIK